MKLINNFFIIIFLFFLISCEIKSSKQIQQYVIEKKDDVVNNTLNKKKITNEEVLDNKNYENIFYLIGDPYFIEGVQYFPQENYNYKKKGLATFYGKELHNVKTANNDMNKVTELLGRHKTLPLPSIVKITNLENGLSLIIKINDRHTENSSVVEVSRKVAQLLRFYKNKIARVELEVLSDPSKQMKLVTESMNNPGFDETISSAPTENVSITDLNEVSEQIDNETSKDTIPVELRQEKIENQNLYLKISEFESYDEAKKILNDMNININYTTTNEGKNYSILLGPLENLEANKLVSSFISKGYKNTEILFK